MLRVSLCLFLYLFVHPRLDAQAPSGSDDAIRVGPGVTPPRVLRKVEPEYSADARANRMQVTAVLQLAVNENGRATGITVISPIAGEQGISEASNVAAADTARLTPAQIKWANKGGPR